MRMICPLSKSGSPAAPEAPRTRRAERLGEAGAVRRARHEAGRQRRASWRPVGGQAPRLRGCRLRVRTSARTPVRTGRALRHRRTARGHPQAVDPTTIRSAAAALSHRLQPLWPRPSATSASAGRLPRGKDLQQPAAERLRGPVRRRRRRQRAQSMAQLTSTGQEGGAGFTVLDMTVDGGACARTGGPSRANRRSRPASVGTSCEVPHAPERPADIRDNGGCLAATRS